MASKLLLDKVAVGSDPAGPTAAVKIAVGAFASADALVLVTASGSSRYEGSKRNTGIVLTVSDGIDSIMDDSFEGESYKITFRAAASHMFRLPAKTKRTVSAKVSAAGAGGSAGGNKNTKVRLHVAAIEVA